MATIAAADMVAIAARPPVATTAAAAGATATPTMAGPRAPATTPPRWWVLDPGDDAACLRELLELHDLEAGRVVCHPRPGATWPVLVEDLLRALGKHPQALARERRTTDAPRLLRVWLRAEQVRHLVVLHTDRLRPEVLDALLTVPLECALWLVWHDRDGPRPRRTRGSTGPSPPPFCGPTRQHGRLQLGATGTPRRFRPHGSRPASGGPEGHRLGWQVPYWEHAWPGCDVGALLQRLTIDAADSAELRMRLRAAQHGFAAEGRRLMLPDLPDHDLAELGPRLTHDIVARLRELVCPATAAGLMLGLATDADAPFLAGQRATGWSDSLERVHLLAGDYRVPQRARALLRAAVLAHDNPAPWQSLFAPPGRAWTSPQRFAHLVRRGASLVGISPPKAARPLYGINPATPFAAAIATRVERRSYDSGRVSGRAKPMITYGRLPRLLTRQPSRSPDQSESIAATLTSTTPTGSATSRTSPPVMSLSWPAARRGQATHTAASVRSRERGYLDEGTRTRTGTSNPSSNLGA